MERVGRGSHDDDISPKRVLNTSPSNFTARTVIATKMGGGHRRFFSSQFERANMSKGNCCVAL